MKTGDMKVIGDQQWLVPVSAEIGETWRLEVSGLPSAVTLLIRTAGGTVIEVPVAQGARVSVTNAVDTGQLSITLKLDDPAPGGELRLVQ